MASVIYNNFKKEINESVDWDDNSTTDIKVMLVTSSYVPNIDTHLTVDQVTNEVIGAGYVAGGAVLINRSISIDNANDLAKYLGDNIVWSTSTITARGAVIYKDTGTPSTSPLICYIDFGEDKVTTNSDFVIAWNTNGIFTLN